MALVPLPTKEIVWSGSMSDISDKAVKRMLRTVLKGEVPTVPQIKAWFEGAEDDERARRLVSAWLMFHQYVLWDEIEYTKNNHWRVATGKAEAARELAKYWDPESFRDKLDINAQLTTKRIILVGDWDEMREIQAKEDGDSVSIESEQVPLLPEAEECT